MSDVGILFRNAFEAGEQLDGRLLRSEIMKDEMGIGIALPLSFYVALIKKNDSEFMTQEEWNMYWIGLSEIRRMIFDIHKESPSVVSNPYQHQEVE